MASDLEIIKGRRDFPIRTLPAMCQWLMCLEGCSVFPESFVEGNSSVLIGARLRYIPLDKRMCFEMKCVYIL